MRLPLAALLGLALTAQEARAQECQEAHVEWARQCGVAVEGCPDARIVVRLGDGLRVELAQRTGGLHQVGAISVAPIGSFADWSAEPRARREEVARIARCVAERPPSLRDAPEAHGDAPLPATPALPWCLVAAVVLALGTRTARARLPRHAWWVLPSFALGALRALLVPAAFFHQNGQGALWVRYALGEPSPYGPGFRELFGAAASTAPSAPEPWLFAAHGALLSVAPLCAAVITRRAGATRPAAALAALAVALDPMAARLASSESYYGCGAALLWLGGAALCTASTSGARRAELFGAVIGGLLLAQAARIHPVLWLPAGLVVLSGASLAPNFRAARTVVAVAGLVLLLGVAPVLASVGGGAMGSAWLPRLGGGLHRLGSLLGRVSVFGWACTGLLLWSARSHRDRARLLALGAFVALGVAADLLGPAPDAFEHAYARLHPPALLPWLAAARFHLPRAPRLALLAALVTLALLLSVSAATTLPTDALELRAAWTWRTTLPAGSTVAFVERAGPRRLLFLPIYDVPGAPVRLRPLGPPDGALPPRTFWYRSSLCSTPDARSLCGTLERSAPLERQWETTLPSRASLGGLDYEAPTVRVGLYRGSLGRASGR